MAFNKEQNLQRIQTVVNLCIALIVINVIVIIISFLNIPDEGMIHLILVFSFLIVTLVNVILIQGFVSIKRYLIHLHNSLQSLVKVCSDKITE